jgi:hypothetical protein
MPAANGVDPAPPPVIARASLAALMRDPETREDLRQRIEETDESLNGIGKALCVSSGTISSYVKKQGWTRPDSAPKPARPAVSNHRLAETMADAEVVKARLLRAVDRQIDKIEQRVRKKDASVDEKEARTLGTLAKTLQTLIALDRDAGAQPDQPEPLDRDELRAALARRLSIWAEQGGEAA